MSLFPHMILFNGNGITMESDMPEVSAVAIYDGKIAALGNDAHILAMVGQNTNKIDLGGRTFLPGFIKTHAHPIIMGEDMMELDCACGSIAELADRVRRAASETPPGQWVIGKGWDEANFAESRKPTKSDIDAVAPNNPVLIYRVCRHMGVANQMALKLAGITDTTEDPAGGGHFHRDKRGKLTGLLEGSAVEALPTPEQNDEFIERAYRKVEQYMLSKGITTTADMTVFPDSMKVYQRLNRSKQLKLRVRFWIPGRTAFGYEGRIEEFTKLGVESGFGNDSLCFQGIKLYNDGSVGGRTAYMLKGYPGDPKNHGDPYCSQEQINDEVRRSTASGMRTAIHAIGDGGIEMAIQAYENAIDKGVDIKNMRCRIEHCVIPSDDQLTRIKELNICVGSSIGFLYTLAAGYARNLFPEDMDRAFPQKAYLDMGISVAANSDPPVCNPNPMLGIYSCVARTGKNGEYFGSCNAVTIVDALRSYTIDAAYMHFDEDKLGSLKVGKYADIIILDRDPRAVPVDGIKEIKILMTIVNGEVVYTCI